MGILISNSQEEKAYTIDIYLVENFIVSYKCGGIIFLLKSLIALLPYIVIRFLSCSKFENIVSNTKEV